MLKISADKIPNQFSFGNIFSTTLMFFLFNILTKVEKQYLVSPTVCWKEAKKWKRKSAQNAQEKDESSDLKESENYVLLFIASSFNPIKGGPLTEGWTKNYIAPSEKYFGHILFGKY